jgi:hypothetical protein
MTGRRLVAPSQPNPKWSTFAPPYGRILFRHWQALFYTRSNVRYLRARTRHAIRNHPRAFFHRVFLRHAPSRVLHARRESAEGADENPAEMGLRQAIEVKMAYSAGSGPAETFARPCLGSKYRPLPIIGRRHPSGKRRKTFYSSLVRLSCLSNPPACTTVLSALGRRAKLHRGGRSVGSPRLYGGARRGGRCLEREVACLTERKPAPDAGGGSG